MPKHHNLSEIIRPRSLPAETGLSRTTCWRLEKDPSSGFPQRIKLTPNGTAVGYIRSEIVKWRESRPAVENNNQLTNSIDSQSTAELSQSDNEQNPEHKKGEK